MPEATLEEHIHDAKAEVAKDAIGVRFAQGRVEHFKASHSNAKRDRTLARRQHRPQKAAFYQARMTRTAGKITLWTGREATAIEVNKGAKAALERLLHVKAAEQPNGAKLVAEIHKYLGTQEGSSLQVKWAHDLGYSSSLPWCSIFAATMMLQAGVITKAQLPSNPAYSGAWIGWAHGRRISVSQARPGDLLIFDWGDGGLTDHVAIYIGAGQMIGGNQSHPGPKDSVSQETAPMSNVVAVIRPGV